MLTRKRCKHVLSSTSYSAACSLVQAPALDLGDAVQEVVQQVRHEPAHGMRWRQHVDGQGARQCSRLQAAHSHAEADRVDQAERVHAPAVAARQVAGNERAW